MDVHCNENQYQQPNSKVIPFPNGSASDIGQQETSQAWHHHQKRVVLLVWENQWDQHQEIGPLLEVMFAATFDKRPASQNPKKGRHQNQSGNEADPFDGLHVAIPNVATQGEDVGVVTMRMKEDADQCGHGVKTAFGSV